MQSGQIEGFYGDATMLFSTSFMILFYFFTYFTFFPHAHQAYPIIINHYGIHWIKPLSINQYSLVWK